MTFHDAIRTIRGGLESVTQIGDPLATLQLAELVGRAARVATAESHPHTPAQHKSERQAPEGIERTLKRLSKLHTTLKIEAGGASSRFDTSRKNPPRRKPRTRRSKTPPGFNKPTPRPPSLSCSPRPPESASWALEIRLDGIARIVDAIASGDRAKVGDAYVSAVVAERNISTPELAYVYGVPEWMISGWIAHAPSHGLDDLYDDDSSDAGRRDSTVWDADAGEATYTDPDPEFRHLLANGINLNPTTDRSTGGSGFHIVWGTGNDPGRPSNGTQSADEAAQILEQAAERTVDELRPYVGIGRVSQDPCWLAGRERLRQALAAILTLGEATARALGKALGCHHDTIYKHAKAGGWAPES
jgi:hypothetical protein